MKMSLKKILGVICNYSVHVYLRSYPPLTPTHIEKINFIGKMTLLNEQYSYHIHKITEGVNKKY